MGKIRKPKCRPGDKVGRWTLIEESCRGKHNEKRWLCKCDCGTVKITGQHSLRNGHSSSCGCLIKEQIRARTAKADGESSFSRLILTTKGNAKRKKGEYSLTRDEFKKIVSQNCYYCGEPPIIFNGYLKADGSLPKVTNGVTSVAISRANILVNGIDRTDSSKGYTYENCKACCYKCNAMKSALSEQEFLAHIEKIYEKNKGA